MVSDLTRRMLESQSSKIRVFIAEDDPVVKRSLTMYLSLQPDLSVCGEAETEIGALSGIAETNPHVVLVDLVLKEGSGLGIMSQLRPSRPELKLLVYSSHEELAAVTESFIAGAHGFVTKQEGTDSLVTAIHSVMRGRTYISDRIAMKCSGGQAAPSQRTTPGSRWPR
jgi:DNA-binding NarL/FixJ family response regulator